MTNPGDSTLGMMQSKPFQYTPKNKIIWAAWLGTINVLSS